MEATRLLRRAGDGDEGAAGELLGLVHGELHALARRMMQGERAGHTLQPTALLNEAWLRLIDGAGDLAPTVEDRRHFRRLAARAMRRVLVDHARARARDKRGGGETRITFHDDVSGGDAATDAVDLLALEEALERLEATDVELARVVELRFFAGLSLEETGAALGTSERAVRHAWSLARAWLRRELERGT